MQVASTKPETTLCDTCVKGRDVRTLRSRFLLCELSVTNVNYPKYPPQPIGRCDGYIQKDKPMEHQPDDR